MRTIVLLLSMLVCAGCGTTPTQQWASTAIALTAAEETLADMHQHGLIGDKLLVDVADFGVKPARAALDKAKDRLPDGGFNFDQLMATAKAGLAAVNEAINARKPQAFNPGVFQPCLPSSP